jgi:hypothetical protein
MPTALIVAMATAAILAIPGFPVHFYGCWMSWLGWKSSLGIILYIVVSGAGGGFIGWAGAQVANAKPTSYAWAIAILYGMAGVAVLRASVPRKVVTTTRSSQIGNPADLKQAVSLLTTFTYWCQELLDYVMGRYVERWLETIPLTELPAVAVGIHVELNNTAMGLQNAAKAQSLQSLTNRIEELKEPDKQVWASACIKKFCRTTLITQHLAKPTLRLATSAKMR